jgi:CheY-like chemotaxis protein
MDISLIASGNLEVKFAPFNFHKVLVQLFNKYKPLCANKKIELKLEIPEITAHKILNTDEELFQKAFSHLLDNAVKFTSTGVISFGYKSYPHLFEFFVKDTGVGIGDESKTLIFESFKQEEVLPHRGYEGSGLGLSIARGIVGLFGGDMRVESKKGFGSTFYFTIHNNGTEIDQEPQLPAKTEITIQRSPVILIAEDDESNLLFMETVLQNSGVPVIIANNGKEAVDLCRQHSDITLVLMDIKMPVMDGLEATREIKSFRKELPVIALTAFAMNLDKTRSLDAGCDDYLSKPFSGDSLFEKLRKYGFLRP